MGKTCTCDHHFSAHEYDPADGGHAPPRRCRVPGCGCTSFVDKRAARKADAERRYSDFLKKMKENTR